MLSIKSREVSEIDTDGYFSLLEDLEVRRSIKSKVLKLNNQIVDKSVNIETILESYQDISFYKKTEDFILSSGTGNILKERKIGINERSKSSGGYFTGFNNLDTSMPTCFYPGAISVIAARPSMGKSLFKNNLQTNICSAGGGVVSFCLEQDFQIEMDRLTALITGTNLKDIIQVWKWEDNDDKIEKVLDVANLIETKWNMHFINKRTMTMMEAINIVSMLKQRSQIDVVFFDLFDRLSDINDPVNKAERIGQKLPLLLEWARILKVHFCLVVQISRAADIRKDHRPQMSDLKSAGAYEEMTDLIMLLYNEKKYNPEAFDVPFEVIVAKQKQGEVFTGLFDLQPEMMKMYEIAQ